MSDLETVGGLLRLYGGIDRSEPGSAVARKIAHWAFVIDTAAARQHPKRDQRPDQLEEELEAVRRQIRNTIQQIEGLDEWALGLARLAKSYRDLEAAGNDPGAIIASMRRHRDMPVDEWPDNVAVRSLRELEDGLKDPIAILISKGRGLPAGKGKKPNLVARNVALLAARALTDLTAKPPSYWKDGTAFANLTRDLFLAFGIAADTRRACEWALSELAKTT